MKGGRAPPPGHHSRFIRESSSSSRRSRRSRSSSSMRRSSSVQNNRLHALGFDEGEIELLLDNEYFPGLTEEQIVEKYLDIAQNEPFNLDWNSEEDAIDTAYMIGVYNSNGSEFSKHDIAKDTFNYFSNQEDSVQSQGLGQGIRKKKRRTRKHRSSNRKHKTRHRRRN